MSSSCCLYHAQNAEQYSDYWLPPLKSNTVLAPHLQPEEIHLIIGCFLQELVVASSRQSTTSEEMD